MLWAMVMLSAIGSSMVATGRNDVALARNLRAAAIVMAAADGAVQQAGFHVLPCGGPSPGQSDCAPWPANGRPIDASRDGVAIAVCLLDEGGKVNPNQANPALLAALLAATGVAPDDAARLGAAIVAWRSTDLTPASAAALAAQYRQAGLPYAPDGQKFAAIDDLRFVIGMTPAILDRLRPDLSIWNQSNPDPALASPTTRAALQNLLGTNAASLVSFGPAILGAQPRALAVTATARMAGAEFTRSAVISPDPNPGKPPLRILAWSATPAAPCR